MQHEARRAVELLAHVPEHVVRRRDADRIAEVVAEQHRPDREPADDERRNRQQDQRQRDDPRAFVRRPAVTVAMIVVTVLVVAVLVVSDRARRDGRIAVVETAPRRGTS